MADSPELGRRLRDAKRDYEKRHDVDLSWREIGERVATVLGRDKPVAYQVVQRWFTDGREPQDFVDTLRAIASVLETDPHSLTFGPLEAQRAPREEPKTNGTHDRERVILEDDDTPLISSGDRPQEGQGKRRRHNGA